MTVDKIFYIVLIVAKCIVNAFQKLNFNQIGIVLIVAKCIVNVNLRICPMVNMKVLIVAKCIVNEDKKRKLVLETLSINSSKVYCKSL